jgi:predicted DNA-binding protein with PD1-like motif
MRRSDVDSIRLHEDAGQTTYLLVFAPGDEVIGGLTAFAAAHQVAAAHFTAIGAFSQATLGFFDVDAKSYRKLPVHEQVEVVTMAGNVARGDKDEPKIHAHAVLSRASGETRGGHLLEARVRPTLEVVLVESPPHLRRVERPELGFALIDVRQSRTTPEDAPAPSGKRA